MCIVRVYSKCVFEQLFQVSGCILVVSIQDQISSLEGGRVVGFIFAGWLYNLVGDGSGRLESQEKEAKR